MTAVSTLYAKVRTRLREQDTAGQARSFSRRQLMILVLLALCIRIYWMLTQVSVIESEGAEYARIAQNLLKGNGYAGTMAGSQLLFPPLFPLIIALFSLVTGNTEIAGRIAALLLGTCLVIPVFFITRHLYGRRVAFISASLAAFYPLLIALSVSVYSEGPFLFLIASGVYWALRALELERARHGVFAGICFGLAYLTRPEAIIYPAITVFALCVVALLRRKGFRRPALLSGCVIGLFALLAIPYIVFLYTQTGQFHLEGKSNVNYMIGRRIISGMSYKRAAFGVDANLDEGPLLNPNRFANAIPYSKTPQDLARYVSVSARHNLGRALQTLLTSFEFGAPVLIFLVFLGLFRQAWSFERIINEGFLLLVLGGVLATLFSVQHFWERFLYPFVPFLLIWTGNGVSELYDWARGTARSLHWRLPGLRLVWGAAVGLMIAALVVVGGADLRSVKSRHMEEKEAGLWIQQYRPGAAIMSDHPVIPYYAEATWLPLPYADPALALRYIQKKQPDFVILTEKTELPYMRDWMDNGIPDPHAKLVHAIDSDRNERVMIYAWDQGGA